MPPIAVPKITRRQREKLRTILRSLVRLSVEIEDPVIVDLIKSAMFDLAASAVKDSRGERRTYEFELKVMALYADKVLIKTICAVMNCSDATVDRVLTKFEVKRRRPRGKQPKTDGQGC